MERPYVIKRTSKTYNDGKLEVFTTELPATVNPKLIKKIEEIVFEFDESNKKGIIMRTDGSYNYTVSKALKELGIYVIDEYDYLKK